MDKTGTEFYVLRHTRLQSFVFITFWIKQQAIGCDHYIKSIPSHYNNNNNNNNLIIVIITKIIIIIIIAITITDLIQNTVQYCL